MYIISATSNRKGDEIKMSIFTRIRDYFNAPSEIQPLKSRIKRRINAEVSELRTQSASLGNSAHKLVLAQQSGKLATATNFIEVILKNELTRLSDMYKNVSYSISQGKHAETVCVITVSNNDPEKIHQEDMFWYVFYDKEGKIIQYVSKHDVLGDSNVNICDCKDYLKAMYLEKSSGTMADDIHNIISSIIDDITNLKDI